MPLFSIIIPAYNRYILLKRAIDSVLSQTYKDFELIVIDDGSTDNTPKIVDEYGNLIKYIRQENLGVSGARNSGIKHSSSQFIALLDSDDIWLPGKLEKHIFFIKENPHINIHQTNEIWIRNGKRVNQMKKHLKPEGEMFLESLELCLISPSSVLLKRNLFEKYGLFDEYMPVCEDYDLWLRITYNEQVGLVSDHLIKKYGGHESQLSKKYWGMDRYRVYAIIKLLKTQVGRDRPNYNEIARVAAIKKCNILLSGAQKRKKIKFAVYIAELISLLEDRNYNKINSQNLLKG